MTHRRQVHRLGIYGDGKYEAITAEIAQAIQAVVPDNRVLVQQRKGTRGIVITAYSRKWPCLFPQHGPGPKHQRDIRLQDWQEAIATRWPELLIRGLIHSDGCRMTNWTVSNRGKRYEYPRYTFTNYSADIREIFCEYLDLLGIAWRQMNAVNISVARREAVARLDEFVGPKT